MKPCAGGYHRTVVAMGGISAWGSNKRSFKDLAAACIRFDDLLWLAARLARDDPSNMKRYIDWLADCGQFLLEHIEREDLKRAVQISRQFSKGSAPLREVFPSWLELADNKIVIMLSVMLIDGGAAMSSACTLIDLADSKQIDLRPWAYTRLVDRFSDPQPTDFELGGGGNQ